MHSEERAAWEAARRRNREADVDAPRPVAPEVKSRIHTLVTEAKRMKADCPVLWVEVQKLASPSFTDDPLAAPSGLSPPERALVLFGQAAVATWLEEIRTFKFEDEEESSDG